MVIVTNSFLDSIILEPKQFNIVLLQWKSGCQSYTLDLRYDIKTNIYELNQTIDYKLNQNFINRIQQIRRGSSWNPYQRGLVAHKRHHYKTI